MNEGFIERLKNNSDVLIAMFIVAIVMMLIIPLPTWLLDILLTFNISFALIILIATMFTRDALEFSVFPSMLLVTTLLRLALNVATTRLILLNADAGDVVESFGSFVVGGNTVVGFIMFLILVVIQYIVITRGAERVSEVGARFTLDAMPGKQMAIDADLNAGLIDENGARARRQKIQDEADFYGAMDGATKFVKGDAIAGIIIVIINIVGGFIIGMLQREMDLATASMTYTILTVGDGLVTQIPALLISTATGIIVTKSASDAGIGRDIGAQIFGRPKPLLIASIILIIMGTMGLPMIPMFGLAAFFGLLYFATRGAGEAAEEMPEMEEIKEAEEIKKPESVVELLQVEKMEMELGYALIPLVDVEQGGDLLDRIVMIRRQCAVELGFVVPPIRIRDNMQLKPNAYSIKIKGMEVAGGELMPDNYLAIGPEIENELDITGIDTIEPAFQLPARWIDVSEKDRAEAKGYTVVDPPSVLATHLTTVIKEHAFELLGRQEIQNIVDFIKESNQAVVGELIPDLMSLGDIQKVLGNLLKEQVSIRDMLTIMETLADYAKITRDPDVLTEYVRQALKRHISKQVAGDQRRLFALTLDPSLEEALRDAVQQTEFGSYLALEPGIAQAMIDNLTSQYNNFNRRNITPVILCAPVLRIYFKRLVEKFLPNLMVLSYNEIESGIDVEVVGMVTT